MASGCHIGPHRVDSIITERFAGQCSPEIVRLGKGIYENTDYFEMSLGLFKFSKIVMK